MLHVIEQPQPRGGNRKGGCSASHNNVKFVYAFGEVPGGWFQGE